MAPVLDRLDTLKLTSIIELGPVLTKRICNGKLISGVSQELIDEPR
jgi:hypothetical protein